MKQTWPVWINESKKVITIKESSDAKQVFFEDEKIGMKIVAELVSKGYKIG